MGPSGEGPETAQGQSKLWKDWRKKVLLFGGLLAVEQTQIALWPLRWLEKLCGSAPGHGSSWLPSRWPLLVLE